MGLEQYIDEIKIIRVKNKKTVEFNYEGSEVVCYIPSTLSDDQLKEIFYRHRRKINSIVEKFKSREKYTSLPPFTAEDVKRLADEAIEVIPGIVRKYAKLMGVTYGNITIRNQKTKWGSCSSKGNLNFNCYIMLFDQPEIEYLVVHELAHRKHMDHSEAFWAEVEKVIPDYKQRRQNIKDKEPEITARRTDI